MTCPKCPHGLGFNCKQCWPEPRIDDFPNLSASLGKAGCDRIRFHTHKPATTASVRERVVQNPHREFMQDIQFCANSTVDDILSGIACLGTGNEEPLSSKRLHVMLQSANRISTGLLETALNVSPRHARRYMAACKLAIYHITRHLNQIEVTHA